MRDHFALSSAELQAEIRGLLRDSVNALRESDQGKGKRLDVLTDQVVQTLAELIDASMGQRRRVYHSTHHALDISTNFDDKDPILILAALFHDCIYLELDAGMSEQQQQLLDVVFDGNNSCGPDQLKFNWPINDQRLEMVFYVFDEAPNGIVGTGRNELLSALLMVAALKDFVSQEHLFRICACIEASIPFRKVDESGKTPGDRLFYRLSLTNRRFHLNIGIEQLIACTEASVAFAHSDLSAFYSKTNSFLDSTWKLLPEWCEQLLQDTVTMNNLLDALVTLQLRYKGLPKDAILPTFRGFPSKDVMNHRLSRLDTTLDVAGCYIATRVSASQILVKTLKHAPGLLELPVSNIMKRIDSAVNKDMLCNPPDARSAEVLHVLVSGRPRRFDWDPAESQFGALVFHFMGYKEAGDRDIISSLGRGGVEGISGVLRNALCLDDGFSIDNLILN